MRRGANTPRKGGASGGATPRKGGASGVASGAASGTASVVGDDDNHDEDDGDASGGGGGSEDITDADLAAKQRSKAAPVPAVGTDDTEDDHSAEHDAAASTASDAIQKAGPLMFRRVSSEGKKQWVHRHGVIKSHFLFLFKSETSKAPAGVVNLKGPSFRIAGRSSPPTFDVTDGEGNDFTFKVPDGDIEAQTAWLVAIKLARSHA
jgi:hypothetical protein